MKIKVGCTALASLTELDNTNLLKVAIPFGAKLLSTTVVTGTVYVHYLYNSPTETYMDKEFIILSSFGYLPDNAESGWQILGSFVAHELSYHVFERVV